MTSAEEIVAALGGRWKGRHTMVRCPSHNDRTPSLSITEKPDGTTLLNCRAGCSQEAVMAALRARGLWGVGGNGNDVPTVSAEDRAKREAERERERQRMVELARRKWKESKPATGTPVEAYLRSRGLTLPIPPSLRYHPALHYTPSNLHLPAMVACVQSVEREICAIHRTYLSVDGKGKAPVAQPKMMLGPCLGGAVRLAALRDDAPLSVGEGIESVLSVMQSQGSPGWAALSTSGLRSLNLPESVRSIVILADNDEPGEEAAKAAAARWVREGRKVRIARPPAGVGDFNDLLRQEGSNR